MDAESQDLLLEILKWVGLAFAAGFIGYFGRHLATIIIERMRRKKAPAPDSPSETPPSAVYPTETPEDSNKLKIAKKQAKAEAKKAKKSSGG